MILYFQKRDFVAGRVMKRVTKPRTSSTLTATKASTMTLANEESTTRRNRCRLKAARGIAWRNSAQWFA